MAPPRPTATEQSARTCAGDDGPAADRKPGAAALAAARSEAAGCRLEESPQGGGARDNVPQPTAAIVEKVVAEVRGEPDRPARKPAANGHAQEPHAETRKRGERQGDMTVGEFMEFTDRLSLDVQELRRPLHAQRAEGPGAISRRSDPGNRRPHAVAQFRGTDSRQGARREGKNDGRYAGTVGPQPGANPGREEILERLRADGDIEWNTFKKPLDVICEFYEIDQAALERERRECSPAFPLTRVRRTARDQKGARDLFSPSGYAARPCARGRGASPGNTVR